MKKLFALFAIFIALTLAAAEPTAAGVADKAVTAVANGSDKAFTSIATGLAPWNKLLVDSMQRLINSTADATNFLVGEIPAFLHEIVVYYAVYYLILFTTGIGMLLFLLWIWKRYAGAKVGQWTLSHNHEGNLDVHVLISAIFSSIWIYFALDLINLMWLKVMLAPKLFLIELALSLVK